MTDTRRDEVFAGLAVVLHELLEPRGIRFEEITLDATLTDELSVDSFLFVELTIGIETRFGISRFPMQKWADTESRRTGPRFTVRSLVGAVVERLDAQP